MKNRKGNSIQSHSFMANALWSMSYSIRMRNNGKISDEEKQTARDLDNQAMYHARMARVTGEDLFLRVR